MQYSVSRNGNTMVVALTGRLTFEAQQEFRAMLQELAGVNAGKWVIDLLKLEFIDSAGLGLLLRAKAHAEKQGAVAALRTPPQGQVDEILKIAHFHEMFEVI